MKLLAFLVLFSCTHFPKKIEAPLSEGLVSQIYPKKSKFSDLIHPKLSGEWTKNFWALAQGGDLLQATTTASVSVVFKLSSIPHDPEDLFSLSVGGVGSSYASRFSIRIQNAQFMGILRAEDSESPQEIFSTGAALRTNTWHRVVMTVNYTTKTASLYLDGHKLETRAQLNFTRPATSDTPSVSFALGAEDDGHKHFFHGEIREVLVWRRELSWAEVNQL